MELQSTFSNFFLSKLKNRLFGNFPRLTYARSGEDIIVEEILGFSDKGFYVDVGAFHPSKFSNTYKFYLQGWRGINIDANKEAIDLFNQWRKRDVNINLAVGEEEKEINFYLFKEDSSMNTVSDIFLQNAAAQKKLQIHEQRLVKMERLETILMKHLPKDIKIDFMSVDVEGHDLAVLKSNNWAYFRPKVIIVETDSSILDIKSDEIVSYLSQQNYQPVAYSLVSLTAGNLFFKDNL